MRRWLRSRRVATIAGRDELRRRDEGSSTDATRTPPARHRRAATLPATHPAWGVAFFAGIGAVVCELALLIQVLDGGPTGALAATGAFIGLAGIVFVLLARRGADRWRPWMTHVGPLVGQTSLVLLLLRAEDPVTAITYAGLFSWAAAYVGLYLAPRQVVAHVLLITAIVTGTTSAVLGVPAALRVMVVDAPVLAAIAAICARLASLLRRQSSVDTLTGLLNRRGLEEAAQVFADAATRARASCSVVAIDLDGFKQVNDLRGHEGGDQLLREVAVAWRAVLRAEDVLARTGGDEFVVLVPGSVAEATARVERLRSNAPAEVGVSAGVARWSPIRSIDEALRRADSALYEAKRTGRGRTVVDGMGPAAPDVT